RRFARDGAVVDPAQLRSLAPHVLRQSVREILTAMCGLGGILQLDGQAPSTEVLARMTTALAHRGPDDRQVFNVGPAGFAHTRLSIIDVPGGRQPMANEDRSVWLVFNGEIYNYRALREELIAGGHTFATVSDTEVIVHLYE